MEIKKKVGIRPGLLTGRWTGRAGGLCRTAIAGADGAGDPVRRPARRWRGGSWMAGAAVGAMCLALILGMAGRGADRGDAGAGGGPPGPPAAGNVRAFGAAGDGRTDDTAAFASALAAGAGQTVFVPAGTYTLTAPIRIPPATTLRGEGSGSVLTTGIGPGNLLTFAPGGYGSTVRDLQVISTGGRGRGVGISTGGAINCLVRDVTFSGPFMQAINVYHGSSVRVEGCHFDTVGPPEGGDGFDGINIYEAANVAVVGNTFRNCVQDAIYINSHSRNVTCSGNTVAGQPEAIQARVDCSNISITGNSFDIQGSTAVTSFGVILQLRCRDCVVAGNTFRATPGSAIPIAGVSVDTACDRAVIANNSIGGGYRDGVAIVPTGGPNSPDCVISGNAITGARRYGIIVAGGADGAVVSGNSIGNGSDTAIFITASRCAITGNTVRGPARFAGINLEGSACSLVGNSFSGGINITGSGNAVSTNLGRIAGRPRRPPRFPGY